LDVVTQDLSVALGTALSETLATFAASSHVDGLKMKMKFEKCLSCMEMVVVDVGME